MLRKLYEYLTLANYKAANKMGSRKIVQRFARGNIYLKNGLYMTRGAMEALAARGDCAVARLRKKAV
jgi:hypothetical protein